MRVKIYDKDWSEREEESSRELVIETPSQALKIVERNGILSVMHLYGNARFSLTK